MTNWRENYIIGHTSTNYWTPQDSTDDIQSINTPTSFTHETWYTETLAHEVIGWANFGVGELVTMDGATQDEKPHWKIKALDQCVPGYKWSDGYSRCHISEATNASAQSCYVGDSGGPVYQRTSTNNVYAAGLIIGGSNDHHTCWFYVIGEYRDLVKGTPLTSTGSNG
jgi:hypothetical protein